MRLQGRDVDARTMLAADRSARLMERAVRRMPGGVNSPVRAFRSVGGDPMFMQRGEGSRIFDADENSYIDYVMSYGPLILGHAHPEVVEAIERSARKGTTFGAPTELEVDGNYHGHGDALLVSAGSGVATLGLPDSPGVTKGAAQDTAVLPYNHLDIVRDLFETEGETFAAVILEPVAGNMGCVPPADGYLEGLREITAEYGTLLIFDEVMTGFRLARGGAQERFGVRPDLTCLGKIIGGGLPVGAYGGRREIMELVAPSGPVYQAGTLSGNPLAMAAGLATLRVAAQPAFYDRLEDLGARWREGMVTAASAGNRPYTINQVGSMVSVFFTAGPVTDFGSAAASDTKAFKDFFWHMLSRGVYLAPSQYEAGFIS